MVIGGPTFTASRKVELPVTKDLISCQDTQEPIFGKLHLIMDTATLSGGMAVAADTNLGATVTILPRCYHRTNSRRCLLVATQHQSKVYLQALNNPLTGFKAVGSEERLPGHPKELSNAFILQYTMI